MISFAAHFTAFFCLASSLLVGMDYRPTAPEWGTWRDVSLGLLLFWGLWLVYKVALFMWYGVQ